MTMIEKATIAVIEKWHPGDMAASAAENGRVIVSPKLYDEARSAVLATLEAMKEPTDYMLQDVAVTYTTPEPKSRLERYNRDKGFAKLSWTKMIEAALSDPPSPQEGLRRTRK